MVKSSFASDKKIRRRGVIVRRFGALDARLIRGKTEHNNRFPCLHDKVTVRQADASAVLYVIDALVRNTGVSIDPSAMCGCATTG